VAITAPVPRPPHHLLGDVTTTEWRSHAILGLARSCTVSLPAQAEITSVPFDRRDREERGHLRAVSSRPRRLGPRSLSPSLFLERCVRAYSGPGCCLSTSATAYDVRTKDPGLLCPRRDDGHDHLPFLRRITHDLFGLPRKAVTRGEPRIFRPCDHGPGAGSSHLRGFARPRYLDHRDTSSTDGLHRLLESSVPIDVHGSLDRAKDVSSSMEALFRRLP